MKAFWAVMIRNWLERVYREPRLEGTPARMTTQSHKARNALEMTRSRVLPVACAKDCLEHGGLIFEGLDRLNLENTKRP
jgi:hypothetical protein